MCQQDQNRKKGEKMDELIKAISQYPNGTNLIVEWENELELKVRIDTIYESTNGLDDEEEGYKEFYACAVEVLSILKNQSSNYGISEGRLMEISMENSPKSIKLEDGTSIW